MTKSMLSDLPLVRVILNLQSYDMLILPDILRPMYSCKSQVVLSWDPSPPHTNEPNDGFCLFINGISKLGSITLRSRSEKAVRGYGLEAEVGVRGGRVAVPSPWREEPRRDAYRVTVSRTSFGAPKYTQRSIGLYNFLATSGFDIQMPRTRKLRSSCKTFPSRYRLLHLLSSLVRMGVGRRHSSNS